MHYIGEVLEKSTIEQLIMDRADLIVTYVWPEIIPLHVIGMINGGLCLNEPTA